MATSIRIFRGIKSSNNRVGLIFRLAASGANETHQRSQNTLGHGEGPKYIKRHLLCLKGRERGEQQKQFRSLGRLFICLINPRGLTEQKEFATIIKGSRRAPDLAPNSQTISRRLMPLQVVRHWTESSLTAWRVWIALLTNLFDCAWRINNARKLAFTNSASVEFNDHDGIVRVGIYLS